MNSTPLPPGWVGDENTVDSHWYAWCDGVYVQRQSGAPATIRVSSEFMHSPEQFEQLVRRIREGEEIVNRWNKLPQLDCEAAAAAERERVLQETERRNAEEKAQSESFVVRLTQEQLDRFVELAEGHQKRSEYVKGRYNWTDGDGQWKCGCAIGCTVRDAARSYLLPPLVKTAIAQPHTELAKFFGLHREIWGRLDDLFEQCSGERGPALTPAFLRTLKPGHDYSLVLPRHLLEELSTAEELYCHNSWSGTAVVDCARQYCNSWLAHGQPPNTSTFINTLLAMESIVKEQNDTRGLLALEVAERVFHGHWASALRYISRHLRDYGASLANYKPQPTDADDRADRFIKCMRDAARKPCSSCGGLTAATDGECAACSCF